MVRFLSKILIIMVAVFGMMVLFRLLFDSAQERKTKEAANQSKVTKTKAWKPYYSLIDNFKILAPADMVYESNSVPLGEDGQQVAKHDTYICQDEHNIIYSITTVTFPPSMSQQLNHGKMLEEVMNEIINDSPQNELLSHDIITYDEFYPGVDFTIRNKLGQIEYYQELFIFPLLYVINVNVDREDADDLHTRFIESFETLK